MLTAVVHVASPWMMEDNGDSDEAVTGDAGTSLLVFSDELAGAHSNNINTCRSPCDASSTADFSDIWSQKCQQALVYIHQMVMRWHYWQGNGLATHRSLVQVLAGHHCVATSGKLLTPVCFSIIWYRPRTVTISVGKVTAGLVENNDSLPPGLWLSHLWADCSVPNAHNRVRDCFTYWLQVTQISM